MGPGVWQGQSRYGGGHKALTLTCLPPRNHHAVLQLPQDRNDHLQYACLRKYKDYGLCGATHRSMTQSEQSPGGGMEDYFAQIVLLQFSFPSGTHGSPQMLVSGPSSSQVATQWGVG